MLSIWRVSVSEGKSCLAPAIPRSAASAYISTVSDLTRRSNTPDWKANQTAQALITGAVSVSGNTLT